MQKRQFKKEDIRLWAVMFANRCRFTSPAYEPHSVEHGFKEGFRVAVEKMQANGINTEDRQLTTHDVMPRTSQNDYVTLCKPNYLAKDGSIKMAREIVNNTGKIIRWEALKSDMYGE